jgi:hypothetical protein
MTTETTTTTGMALAGMGRIGGLVHLRHRRRPMILALDIVRPHRLLRRRRTSMAIIATGTGRHRLLRGTGRMSTGTTDMAMATMTTNIITIIRMRDMGTPGTRTRRTSTRRTLPRR